MITVGTPAYRAMGLALFLAGFSTFSMLYCVQPLLPALAHHYRLDAGTATLALSLATGALAFAILTAGAFSPALGRRGLMFGSMAAAAALNLAAAFAPNWPLFLLVRGLEGIALGGVPAVAMAYLAEETDPAHLGRAMGRYVAGTAFGSMIGRVLMGVLGEAWSWRVAMATMGVAGLAAALAFFVTLPPSRHFRRTPVQSPAVHVAIWAGHLRDPRLRRLFALGFILTSVFVTLFNYAAFHLSAAPYNLGQTRISLIFLSYGLGMIAASRAGAIADRLGRTPVLAAGIAIIAVGLLAVLLSPIYAVIAGIALITCGFFVSHSVVSGWVSARGGATRGHASSLYLLFYYLGASVTSVASGLLWAWAGWAGVVLFCVLLAACALLLVLGGRGGGERPGLVRE